MISKYIAHAWGEISFEDYISLMHKQPNDDIKNHEIYQEYTKKIKAKTEQERWNKIMRLEQEKLLYFTLAYPQQVVIVKTGKKKEGKQFLGYEFSERKGCEGIHPMQKNKIIDECTSLFDPNVFDNPKKASTYIHKAFQGDLNFQIDKSLQKNISRIDLVDMMNFDGIDFEKRIFLSVKKKIKFESIWDTNNLELLETLCIIKKGTSITEAKTIKGNIPVIAGGKAPAYHHNESNRDGNIITISASGANAGFLNYFIRPIFASDCNTIKSKNEEVISTKLIYLYLKIIQPYIYGLQRGQAQPHVYGEDLAKIKIPLPAPQIQEKIVSEIKALEERAEAVVINNLEEQKELILRKYLE